MRVPKFPGRVVETDSGPSTLRYQMWNPDLYIQGASTWSTSSGDCNFPPKTETRFFRYAVAQAKLCTLTAESSFADWPGVQGRDQDTIEGNHLAIIFLARAYILSARWEELQSSNDIDTGRSHQGMQYSDLQAEPASEKEKAIVADAMEIDIGETDKHAARWWAAILAPADGWQARIQVEGRSYRSPWSVHLAPEHILTLRKTCPHALSDSTTDSHGPEVPGPPSSQQAVEWLQQYCTIHRISSQCTPALAASLFIP